MPRLYSRNRIDISIRAGAAVPLRSTVRNCQCRTTFYIAIYSGLNPEFILIHISTGYPH